MVERDADQRQTVGVILRDATGALYAIDAESLATFRVADEERPLVEALLRGEDVVGFGRLAGGADGFAAFCRSLQDADGTWARSLHLTHVAVSLWVLGR